MDVYKRLARKLNRLPHGFPATESGVELKILRKIFSPEDAAFALKLRTWPQTAETIAKRLKLPLEQLVRRWMRWSRRARSSARG